MARLFVIDEELNELLVSELSRRGKNAVSLGRLMSKGMKNPELLERLAPKAPDCVFITGDDSLPIDHRQSLAKTSISVAIVDPDVGAGYDPDQWDAEIVHRWAHKMEVQAIGTVRRYTLNGHSPWHPRKRPRTSLMDVLERQTRS